MNLVQANRLVKLAQYLEEMDAKDWDYCTVQNITSVDIHERITENGKEVFKVDCGTTACALGSCPNVFPNKFTSNLNDMICNLKDGYCDAEEAVGDVHLNLSIRDENTGEFICNDDDDDTFNEIAQGFFGITEDEFNDMFYGCNTDITYGVSMRQVTKTMVANHIYKLLDQYGYEVV